MPVFLTLCLRPRCSECHSTLLPGSYKLESSSGVLVCTHHVAKHTSASHNGRPDLSKGPPAVQSARIGRSTVPRASLSDRETEAIPSDRQLDNVKPANDSVSVPAVSPNEAEPAETVSEGNGEKEEAPRSVSPPNPFDESDEEEQEEDNSTANCLPSTPADQQQGVARPVPAPRRVSEPTPPPRPAPRVRLLRPADGEWFLRCSLLIKRGDPHLPVTFQVKPRSPPLLRNLVSGLSLLEGNVKYLFFCPLLHSSVSDTSPVCVPPACWTYPVVLPCVTPPSVSVSQCPACPVARINLKTRLGSLWYSRNTRRRKPPPPPLPDRQQSQTQALCPLSKGRTPDPAHPLHLPTRSTKTRTKERKATQWKRRGAKALPSQRRL